MHACMSIDGRRNGDGTMTIIFVPWVTLFCTLLATMSTAPSSKYEQDGEAAREIAKYLPFFPFKGIDRFYDIGGFLYEPAIFQKIVDIFAERYSEIGIDSIAG